MDLSSQRGDAARCEVEKALIDMHSVALALAHVWFPLDSLQTSLGTVIATRMRSREGVYLWQKAKDHSFHGVRRISCCRRSSSQYKVE